MSAWGSALQMEATRHTEAAEARQAVLDGLVAERYGRPAWWPTPAKLCQAEARRGTGAGVCGAVLDGHGCPRAGAHL